MAKFNVVQKHRRAAIADRKRAIHGDPLTKKLKQKHNKAQQQLSISGKRKRKLFKKWRRDQKEAEDKAGLITLQDVEMMAIANVDAGTSDDANKQAPKKFHMKKSSKFKLRLLKKKDRNRRKADKRPVEDEASKDAMEE